MRRSRSDGSMPLAGAPDPLACFARPASPRSSARSCATAAATPRSVRSARPSRGSCSSCSTPAPHSVSLSRTARRSGMPTASWFSSYASITPRFIVWPLIIAEESSCCLPEAPPRAADASWRQVSRDLLPSTTCPGCGLLALYMTTNLTDKAREALRLAEADPGQSVALAAVVAAQAKAAHDLAAAAIAERALGLPRLHVE